MNNVRQNIECTHYIKCLGILQNPYLGSDTRHPTTPSNPKMGAAIAAAAMVLVLLGASEQTPLTLPERSL